MRDELEAEITRVAKLASQAQHAASAAVFMGGTGRTHIERRDALLGKLRTACEALAGGTDVARAESLASLRVEES